MKTLSQLPIISTIDALCSIISEEVFNGLWHSGEKLRENELTKRFNVSRHSIREAFAVLVEQGVLHKAANKGVCIPIYSENDVSEIFCARRVIEEEGIRRIIASREVPIQLNASLQRLKTAGQDAPRMDILTIDMEFHWELVKILDNSRLSNIYRNIITEIKLLNAQPKLFFPIEDIIAEHSQIVLALDSGDEKQALEAYVFHSRNSIERQIGEMRKLPCT